MQNQILKIHRWKVEYGAPKPLKYKRTKTRYDEINTTLLRDKASWELDKIDYSSKIHGCFNLLTQLDKFYAEASVGIKQKIVGLNLPEKFVFTSLFEVA
jgi:hypothetical protein